MSETSKPQMMEDPYYWRNKVLSWRAASEINNRDSKDSSKFMWVEEVSREKHQDQHQSALNKLWYKDGMQVDLNSRTDMAESLKATMKHIKDMMDQAKKSGNFDMLRDMADDPSVIRQNQEEIKIKSLAVAALAEADGHAPDAKKILDEVGSERRKKLKTEFKQTMKQPSAHNSGR